jgi:hypothetical protein
MVKHIPSLDVSRPDDDRWLDADLRLARLRSQLAAVRALSSRIDHLTSAEHAVSLGGQVIEEIARLGCRLLEAAASLTEVPRPEASGVFIRRSAIDGISPPLHCTRTYPTNRPRQ